MSPKTNCILSSISKSGIFPPREPAREKNTAGARQMENYQNNEAP